MIITIVGAAGGEVTVSAYYVRTKPDRVLVDSKLPGIGDAVEI
jgi:hypothetical protein